MSQGNLATHNYEASSPFLEMPSGTATRAISTKSQGTPKIKPSMTVYFHFSLKHELNTNCRTYDDSWRNYDEKSKRKVE